MENKNKLYLYFGAGVAVFAAVAYAGYKIGEIYGDSQEEVDA